MTIIADGNGLRAWAEAFYDASPMPPDEIRVQSRALVDLCEVLDKAGEIEERLRTALEDLIEEHVVVCKHVGCKPKQPWYAAKAALSK